jgi:PmbA protein
VTDAAALAKEAVAAALSAGATDADAALSEQTGLEVRVRNGEVEHVSESRSKSLGVRAFRGRRTGYSYTNDVSAEGVRRAARRAAELASIAAEDAAAGPPDDSEVGAFDGNLDVVDPESDARGVDHWLDAARESEAAAKSRQGVTMSEGARAGGGRGRTSFATSRGFAAIRERTGAHLYVAVVAEGSQGERQRAAFGQSGPHWSDLKSPREIGDEAASRAVGRIGWKKPPTGAYPVVFAPDIARDFAQKIAMAVSAAAVFRRATFLVDRVGQQIASPALTLIDDATLPRRAGSRPFDGEGVRSRRSAFVEQGRLASWLADSYSARRTGARTTGNAARGAAGETTVAATNLVLVPGARPAEALIADAGEGLYVDDLFHFGVNLTSGAWSRGGSGRWISGGKLAHPVQELTIAGDLSAMLLGFREAADDLEWDGACAAPTVRVDGLTVAAG